MIYDPIKHTCKDKPIFVCDSSCLSCNGGSSNNCLSCAGELYFH
jgi:hypothetical protein